MKQIFPKAFFFFVYMLLLTAGASAQRQQIRKGNQLYQEQKYGEAAESYQQGLSRNPAFLPGVFNLGNALYQQKNYEGARKAMDAVAKQPGAKDLKANAQYNIGNTYLSEQKWQEAAEAYKAALRSNPQDEAAKYNLSYALSMMKKEQGDGGKDNKQDQNKDNKDQDKDNKDQNKDQQDKQDQNKDEQNKDQQNPKEDKEGGKGQEQRPQPQPSKLTREQADQLLNALAQEEKKLHDKKEKGKAVKVKVEKDW